MKQKTNINTRTVEKSHSIYNIFFRGLVFTMRFVKHTFLLDKAAFFLIIFAKYFLHRFNTDKDDFFSPYLKMYVCNVLRVYVTCNARDLRACNYNF